MTKMLNEILKLSEAERILLVEAIWDSIGQKGVSENLSEAQELELKKRLESYQNDPENLLTWDEVKASLRK
ncbi:MAG: addiction module protein [Bacteroidia bacterium]|nr:addiction module protein [Bacteroidia bacterium]